MKNSEPAGPPDIPWTQQLRRIAPLILGCVGLFTAVWAVRLNLTSALASVPSIPTETPDVARPSYDIEITLPDYQSIDPTDGISRWVEIDTLSPHRSRVEVLRYTVQSGDSIFGIARKFDLEPETILWGNYEVLNDDPHMIEVGQELNILPVNGTYYQWQVGDNLESVAGFFDVEPETIIEWPGNGIDFIDPVIEPGVWLIVPGGKRELRRWLVPTIARGQAGVGTALGPGGCTGDYTGGIIGTGGFIWPTANHYISGNDYWSGHLAIDIAAGYGAAIWAADSGVAVFAGWSTVGYGYMVMLDHGNGWQTLYAHLSQVNVGCGQNVTQGQLIALGGSTGNSTGPHLHFETRYEGGFVNPWYVLP
ncbi:MAG: peptidoglycan DD-metalloendopeptidase family protein [Anaerolineaceae bacterium]|nr:MAG: peptidoglycan DD-metalloendopeptidase family protein [Anaerolineaceae bacterium]